MGPERQRAPRPPLLRVTTDPVHRVRTHCPQQLSWGLGRWYQEPMKSLTLRTIAPTPALRRDAVWPQGRPRIRVPNESELPKVHLPPDEHVSRYTEASDAPAYNVDIWVQGRGAPRPILLLPLARKTTNPPQNTPERPRVGERGAQVREEGQEHGLRRHAPTASL